MAAAAAAASLLYVVHIHVLLDAPIILRSPCSSAMETEQDPKGLRPDEGIEESIKALVATS